MTMTFQTYGDARSAANVLVQLSGEDISVFEHDAQFTISGWGGDSAERESWNFVGRALADGTWVPRHSTDEEARSRQTGPVEKQKEKGETASGEDSPLATIEITRKTVNVLNSEADKRGVSREAFRALAITLMCYDTVILDTAERLVRHHGLTSVENMAERNW